jgi:hypothetical protein
MGWRELAECKVGDKLTYNPGYQNPYQFLGILHEKEPASAK